MEVRVARMVVLMVLAFLVTWLPYAAMALAVIMNPSLHIDPVIATIPVYLAKSSTVYNPIIYMFMNRQVIRLFSHTIRTPMIPFPMPGFNYAAHVCRVCSQFRGYAIPTVCCGWNPCAAEPHISEGECTVASVKSQQVSA